jgi:hypothetical protein
VRNLTRILHCASYVSKSINVVNTACVIGHITRKARHCRSGNARNADVELALRRTMASVIHLDFFLEIQQPSQEINVGLTKLICLEIINGLCKPRPSCAKDGVVTVISNI